MPSYKLNIDFAATDLGTLLSAGENVVITKTVNGSAGSSVAWVTFSPLEQNTVSWTDSYTLYASTSSVQNGATINMLSQAPGAETMQLPFTNLASFGAATPGLTLPVDTYGLVNQYLRQPAMTFGLAQEANVSGTGLPASPINAALVPMNHQATFQPLEIIQVFMQANIDSGMVLTEVYSNTIDLTFGAGVNEQTIVYSPAVGGFVLKPRG
ncbi:hypothetical protein [Leeia aquatica]|uniref:Uncharacterized protein n=1 Tax=Leeia aquatica TaxID=2725557 RepID=A0A847RWR6_9NEIS|nr:hypothetical protein [Leeia aquatica]NLR74231.1 hypothetical protein [Leeia aquatica]